MMYLDPLYFVLVVPFIIISMIAQYKVKSTYKRYAAIQNFRGLTGAAAAQQVLSYYGITDVTIRQISGTLTDNFNPTNKVISLSGDIYNGTSIAAVGIACHEAGHAAQHAENYAPIKIRNSIIPICNIGSTIGLPLAILGYILGFGPLVYVGLILYAAVFVFQLVTLPVEFNASSRAMKVIKETNLLFEDEVDGARSVLTAAAMTYVAAMLVSLGNLLRFVIRFSGRRN